jgi:hypothetical protein
VCRGRSSARTRCDVGFFPYATKNRQVKVCSNQEHPILSIQQTPSRQRSRCLGASLQGNAAVTWPATHSAAGLLSISGRFSIRGEKLSFGQISNLPQARARLVHRPLSSDLLERYGVSILTTLYSGTRAISNGSWRITKPITSKIDVIAGWSGLNRLKETVHLHLRPQALIHIAGDNTATVYFRRRLRRELKFATDRPNIRLHPDSRSPTLPTALRWGAVNI